MKLKKSNKKIPNELKNRLDFVFDNFDFTKNIQKNDINPENYRLVEKNLPESIKQTPINLGSIKKEILNPLEKFISNKIDNISFLNKNENNHNYYYKNINDFLRNNTKNETNIRNITNKKIKLDNTSQKINNKYLNIDYKTLFSPSEQTQNKILNKFSNNNDLNIKNITKNTNNTTILPALKEGGVVKEPTVGYLHENEAVIPLKQSNEFKNFMKNISENILNKNIKNESNNINNMRNQTINQKTIQQTKIENKQKEQKQEIISNNPINITQVTTSNGSNPNPTIPLVYAGSGSKDDFFNSTITTPRWRKVFG